MAKAGWTAACLALLFVAGAGAAPMVEEFRGAAALLDRPGTSLQEQRGTIMAVPDPAGSPRRVLHAVAGPKRGAQVGKAALILPFDRLGDGARIVVEAEMFLPAGAPRNSVHLMDLECKFCGVPGNPGLRLYLRHGRLRVDRSKIAGGHAWVDAGAPTVPAGRWVRLSWELALARDPAQGLSVVRLDGLEVLRRAGRALPDLPARHAAVDRLRVGVTANSNAVAATILMARCG